MGFNYDGRFSANLLSLQLQLKTLFDEAGGEGVMNLLDSLCKLTGLEQKIALDTFNKVIERIAHGDKRFISEEDQHLKDFEDGLYKDVINSMFEASTTFKKQPLELVAGGKAKEQKKEPIDFNQARAARKGASKPVLN